MSSLYLDESLTDADLKVGRVVTISGTEAHHAVSVSRVRVGERVLIGNGAGTQAETVVEEIAPKLLTCRVESVTSRPLNAPRLLLVQSLAKGDRDERAVESATEVGVDEIYPYQAHRSVSRWNKEKADRGRERWQKLAREAAKQSLRHRVPEVRELLQMNDLCELARSSLLLVLEPSVTRRLSDVDATQLQATTKVALIVGPEGGFDQTELQALEAVGAELVCLGETVLRTSTAGVAALSIVNAKLGRW